MGYFLSVSPPLLILQLQVSGRGEELWRGNVLRLIHDPDSDAEFGKICQD
jgi:hypothetical protein